MPRQNGSTPAPAPTPATPRPRRSVVAKQPALAYDTPNARATIESMTEAAAMFRDRRAQYGPSELKFGTTMAALFPNGITLTSVADWQRFGVLVQIINKLSRYSTDFGSPHLDSVRDLGVYAFMLEGLDLTQDQGTDL